MLLSDSFATGVGVRYRCVISPELFNFYLDSFIKEMKAKVWNLGVKLRVKDIEQSLQGGLFAYTVVGRKLKDAVDYCE